MCYSLWYNAPTMLSAGSLEAEELRLQATGWQHRGFTIQQAVTQSSAPADGQNDISMMHCQANIKIRRLVFTIFGTCW